MRLANPYSSARRARLQLLNACALTLLTANLWAGTTQCINTDPVDWQWLHPSPHGQEGTTVHWIPERSEFVAMGDAVQTTTDGSSWSLGHRFASWTVNDFVWTGTEFFAVLRDFSCYNGAIPRSTDLLNWTTVETTDRTLLGIAWNGTRFVVATSRESGTDLLVSEDAVAWTLVDAGSSNGLYDVVFANGQFVAVGPSGMVVTSPDRLTWTPQSTSSTAQLDTVIWSGSQYLASSLVSTDLLTSADGITWETKPLPASPRGVTAMGSTVRVFRNAHVGSNPLLATARVYSSGTLRTGASPIPKAAWRPSPGMAQRRSLSGLPAADTPRRTASTGHKASPTSPPRVSTTW